MYPRSLEDHRENSPGEGERLARVVETWDAISGALISRSRLFLVTLAPFSVQLSFRPLRALSEKSQVPLQFPAGKAKSLPSLCLNAQLLRSWKEFGLQGVGNGPALGTGILFIPVSKWNSLSALYSKRDQM